MRCGLIAKKIGMTRIFGDNGQSVPVSVLKMDNCEVISKKTKDIHGYNALQIGFGSKKAKNIYDNATHWVIGSFGDGVCFHRVCSQCDSTVYFHIVFPQCVSTCCFHSVLPQ